MVLLEPILTCLFAAASKYKSWAELMLNPPPVPVEVISVPPSASIFIPALAPVNVISLANKSPLALMSPCTCNFFVGFAVPIPTNPADASI